MVDSVSRIRPPGCFKLSKNPKNDNDVTIFQHGVNVKLFWRCFASLVKFSYWSKFRVNIITGSGIMTIFFNKGVTRNTEIRNTVVWVFFMDTKLGTNISNRMLMNAAKFRVTAFTVFELLRENQLRGENLTLLKLLVISLYIE